MVEKNVCILLSYCHLIFYLNSYCKLPFSMLKGVYSFVLMEGVILIKRLGKQWLNKMDHKVHDIPVMY